MYLVCSKEVSPSKWPAINKIYPEFTYLLYCAFALLFAGGSSQYWNFDPTFIKILQQGIDRTTSVSLSLKQPIPSDFPLQSISPTIFLLFVCLQSKGKKNISFESWPKSPLGYRKWRPNTQESSVEQLLGGSPVL